MAATSEQKAPATARPIGAEALTVACGAAGALLFAWLRVPGGAMSGSVIAVATLSAFGRAAPISAPLRILALVTMGVAIGAVVGPDTFSNIAAYPLSIALMGLCVVAMTLVSTAVWSLSFGWPPAMSLLASVPGSMSYIVSVSLSMGADVARVAVVQMSRVIFLVTILPWIIVWESGGHIGASAPAVVDPLPILLATMAAGLGGGWLLQKIGMTGAMLLGALMVSGVIHFLGLAPGRAPLWFLNAGQTLLGAWVGTRFINFDWRLFGAICVGTIGSVGSAILVSVAFAALASALFHVSFGTALIAYAPGGQDAMMVLALSLGVDPIFVSAHHLARYFMINVSLPFLVAWMRPAGDDQPAKD